MGSYNDIQDLAASSTATFHDVIGFWAGRTPDAPAILTESGGALSYAGLLRVIDAIGASLDSCGFGRGDRIAVVHPGGADLASALIGIWSHATVIPLSPKYRLGEYLMYLRDLRIDAIALAAGPDTPARTAAAQLGLPILELVPSSGVETGVVRLEGEARNRPHATGLARHDDVAAVLMTSGTTLESKLVPRRQSHLVMRAANSSQMLEYTSAERGANLMQLYHGAGLGAITYTLFAGGSLANFPDPNLPRIFRSLETLKPTYISGPYTVFHAILAQQERLCESICKIQPGLRFLRAGAGHLDPRIAEKLEAIFDVPVIQAYSSSETSFMACEPLPPRPRKRGSVGLPGNTKIAIVDEHGNRLPANAVGEIIVSGRGMFDGYENNPAANAEAFADGWFHIGDMGYFDEDGYLFVTGRVKDVINRGGQKFMPGEIDAAIMAHPGVLAAATFPVPHPTLGDDIAAAVVPEAGATLDRKTLTDFLRVKLGDAKVPHQILFVDDIPKGKTGKIQRYKLAAAFGLDRQDAARPSGARAGATTPTEATLQRIWAETLKLSTVPLDENFFTLGGDSIMAVELFLRIEEALGRRLPRTVLFETGTVTEMAAAIDADYRATCLVPIQPAGDKPIFFCIHGVDGDVLYFRDLARHLGDTQPFYGIRARGLDGTTDPCTAISDMANCYVDEIRRVQPQGPYYIGGYSFGGWPALEVARRLREGGEDVALLAIFDTHCTNGRPTRPLVTRFATARQNGRSKRRSDSFGNNVRPSVINALRLDTMAIGCRLGFVTDRLNARFRRYPIEAHSVALRQFRPARYDGDAVLFYSRSNDTELPTHCAGWKTLIAGNLATRPVNGSHYDMMYEPDVAVLARELAASIAQAGTRRE